MEIAPGSQLGRLEILSEIPAGGVGEFFRARDTKTDQEVGVRVLPLENGSPLRFEQEHYTAASLKHPNILAIRGLRSKLGISYIITAKVEGESLASMLRRGPLPFRRTIEIGAQVADALGAAHAMGLVHRDLRPDNILVDQEVKVFDFAVVKPHRAEREITRYVSPEELFGEPVDGRSDIFSLGAILYEMTTGNAAFTGDNPADLKHAILEEIPQEPPATVPPELVNIMGRCLDRDPAGRFQTAADLSLALQNCADIPAVAPPPERPRPQFLTMALDRLHGFRGARFVPIVRSLQQRQGIWIPAGIALLALLVAGDLAIRARTSRPEIPRFQQVTFRQGLIFRSRFTADGKSVVYTARFEGSPQATYIATPGNTGGRDLNLPAGSSIVAVSAKGELAVRLSDGVLVRQPLSGGAPRQEAENVYDADWSPDGERLAVAWYAGPGGQYRIEFPMGNVLYQSDQPLHLVRVAPDGVHVAFTTWDGQQRRLWVMSRSGNPKMLAFLNPGDATRTLCWSSDSREIWYSSLLPQNRGMIQAVNLSGARRKVNWLPEAYLDDVSRDGKAAVEVFHAWSGILFHSAGESAERDLSWQGETINVKLSADGRRALFTEYGGLDGATFNIFARPTDGSHVTFAGTGNIVAASPDGKWVTAARGTKNPKYFLVATDGSGAEAIVVRGLENETGAVAGWLRGGKDYVVWGKAPGKPPQYFVWTRATGALRPVGPYSFPLGMVSDDGTSIIAAGGDRKWYVLPVAGGEPKPARGLQEADTLLGWSRDSRSVFAAVPGDGGRKFTIQRVDVATGARTAVTQLDTPLQAESIVPQAITPDGKSAVYTYYRAQSDLYVAEGLK